MQPLSLIAAAAILEAFSKRHINLDEEFYEQCVDTIVEALEKCNDDKFRLTARQPKPLVKV